MKEIYKDIIGYEGFYQVSNLGNVKRLNYRGSGKERVLKNYLSNIGYYKICLSIWIYYLNILNVVFALL